MGLQYPHLFAPLKVRGALFRNRIFDSPEGYLVSGGGVFCGCHFVWRALCGDWQ